MKDPLDSMKEAIDAFAASDHTSDAAIVGSNRIMMLNILDDIEKRAEDDDKKACHTCRVKRTKRCAICRRHPNMGDRWEARE